MRVLRHLEAALHDDGSRDEVTMSAAHLPRRQFFTPAAGSPTACYLRADVALEAAQDDVDEELAVVKRERDDARKELRLVREMVARLITSIASALRAE